MKSRYIKYSVQYSERGVPKIAMAWGGKPSAGRAFKIMVARAEKNDAITDIELLGMTAESKIKVLARAF